MIDGFLMFSKALWGFVIQNPGDPVRNHCRNAARTDRNHGGCIDDHPDL
jgi:hypothetical protein